MFMLHHKKITKKLNEAGVKRYALAVRHSAALEEHQYHTGKPVAEASTIARDDCAFSRELLLLLSLSHLQGLQFTTRPPLFEENLDKVQFIGKPQEYVLTTAEHKARGVCETVGCSTQTTKTLLFTPQIVAEPSTSKRLVLACDTVVVVDGEIMEKPMDRERAYEMLSKLAFSYDITFELCCLAD